MNTLQERLRSLTATLRRTPLPISSIVPELQLAADRIDALEAENAALRVDAERMRWIAAHCRSTAEHWGGRWSIVIDGPAPVRHDEEDALYAAIDAARSKT